MFKPRLSSTKVRHDPNAQQPMMRADTRPTVISTIPHGPADSAGPEIPGNLQRRRKICGAVTLPQVRFCHEASGISELDVHAATVCRAPDNVYASFPKTRSSISAVAGLTISLRRM